ncbi:MAG TPA: MaoC family dehydratase N-terminal domain-containing protein [Candidatus Dormibacteraeota bacterium]|nr:MaoC family dehydratase N-terminal domain-containing protein [Candidatus Dormibacteraeota bacterium]
MSAERAASVVERLRARIGREVAESVHTIEAGHVRRFCEAIGDDDPRWREQVPPTFVVALGTETPELPEALEHGRGWLNGGDRFEYLEPIRIGDTIRARSRLVDAYEKRGRSGDLLFLVFETEYINQHGRVAVRSRGTRIRR